MKSFLKNTIEGLFWGVIASLLSAFILGLTYYQFGFFPFGNQSILVMDMLQQNVAFFQSLRQIWTGDNSFFFSLTKSIGGNYLGLFAFYLSSPLSWIVLFFPNHSIHIALFYLMWIKTALSAATMMIFLRNVFPSMRFRSLLLAVAYSLMSYNFVYSLSLMWLDGVLLLPLVMLGIERLLNRKQPLLFGFSYGWLLLANYYTAYMVGVFAFLYWSLRLLMQSPSKQETQKQTFLFFSTTALTFLLTAWYWMPVAVDLFSGKLETGTWMNPNLINFNLFDLFTKFLPNEYDSIIVGLPSIYVGWSLEIAALVFFFLPQYTKKEKLHWGLFILIMVLSFWIVRIDDAWHGFVSPNWFPYRYAFLFSFLLLLLAAKTLRHFSFQLKPHFLSFLFVFLYGPILMDLSSNGVSMLQGLDQQFGYMEASQFQSQYDETENALSLIEPQEGIYRIEKDYEITKNDPMLFGYFGVSHYSSNYIAKVNQSMQRLGFAQAWYWNSYQGSTPVMDAFLGIRYVLSHQTLEAPWAFYDQTASVQVYENSLALPLIFSSHEAVLNLDYQSYDPFVEQMNLLTAMYGTSLELWRPLTTTETIVTDQVKLFQIEPQFNQPIYFYIDSNTHGSGYLNVNGQYWGSYFGQMTSKISTLEPSSGLTPMVIRVQNNSPEKMTVYDGFFYQLDLAHLTTLFQTIQQRSDTTLFYEQGGLEGTVTVEENHIIATSLPYLSGYTIYLNGKKVPYRSYYSGTFLGIPVTEPGTYSIKIEYVSDGFWLGFSTSLLTLVSLLSFFYYDQRLKRPLNPNPLRNGLKSSLTV